MRAESNIGQLERLMGNGQFPWTLTRGPIRMGPSFDVWTVEGRGFGDFTFSVTGTTPDEAVEAAILHLGGSTTDPNADLKAQAALLTEKIEEVEDRIAVAGTEGS